MSIFEGPELERSLFFPSADLTSPPPDAIAPADGRAITEASTHPHSRFVAFAGHGHNDLFAAAAYVPTLDAWLRAASMW
jgi:hypothetical protein